MKVETGEIITLSNDKEYICFSTLTDNGIDYLYLISNFTPVEVKFAKQTIENDSLMVTIINDLDEKRKVLELFENNKDIDNL